MLRCRLMTMPILISCLICGALGALWGLSKQDPYEHIGGFSCGFEHYRLWVACEDGRLVAASAWIMPENPSLHGRVALEEMFSVGPNLMGTEFEVANFSYSKRQVPGAFSERTFKLPLWPLIALSAFLPLRHVLRFTRFSVMQRRHARGQCVACGYDLRASPGRCPECGATIYEPSEQRT